MGEWYVFYDRVSDNHSTVGSVCQGQGGRSGNGNRGVTKVLLGIVCPLAGPGNAVGRERQAPLEREKDAPLATIPHPKVVPVPVAHAKSYTNCNPATGDLLIRLGP